MNQSIEQNVVRTKVNIAIPGEKPLAWLKKEQNQCSRTRYIAFFFNFLAKNLAPTMQLDRQWSEIWVCYASSNLALNS